MRQLLLAGVFTAAASVAFAQTTPTAPASPGAGQAAQAAQPPAAAQGGPANLCQELLGFMKGPPPPSPPAAIAGKDPPPSTPRESVMTVQDAEALAQANDIIACRDAARKMRLAGVAMPSPLLALTALDPKFLEARPQ